MDVEKAINLATTHYENFPVIPFFMPKKWRKPTAFIYAFARSADDIADEGDDSSVLRLEKLNFYEKQLNVPSTPFFIELEKIITKHNLPKQAFYDLLIAFKQDVVNPRYLNEEGLLYYCKHSAEPVGHLMLALANETNPESIHMSNCLCTSLQLINFIQDLKSDIIDRQRLYIPIEDLKTFSISESMIFNLEYNESIQALINFQCYRAHQLLIQGQPLLENLSGRFKMMISLTYMGAKSMLSKLKHRPNIYHRPTHNKKDWVYFSFKYLLGLQ